MVSRFATLQELSNWLERVQGLRCHGATIQDEALSYLVTISLLFGFESKPNAGLLQSRGSIFRNWRLSEEEKTAIWQEFYDPGKYLSGKDLGDVVVDVYSVLRPLHDQPGLLIFERIKQWGSLVEKMRRFIARQIGGEAAAALSVAEMIVRTRQACDKFSQPESGYLDDLIGFNLVIDDQNWDPTTQGVALNYYTTRAQELFATQAQFPARLNIVQKESRLPGFKAANIFVYGWLNHRHYGDVPIKLQFRFKTALYGEAAMYYVYKTTGRWELPPWATEINFQRVGSFPQLQERLFRNFNDHFAAQVPARPFSLRDLITMPPGKELWLETFPLDPATGIF